MDVTEITVARWPLLGRARRRWAAPAGPPSLRAQLVLMLSVFVLGCVLAGLVFVGTWRHTALDASRAKTNELTARQALHVTSVRLARVEAELATARTAAASAHAQSERTAGKLATIRHVNAAAASSLAPRLQAIASDAEILNRETARLESALATLRDYLRHAAATGVDPSFFSAQVGYLTGRVDATRAAASALAQQAGGARASIDALRQKR
jgi:hypothetical protein